ncbi:UvrD-helicase domain-containing protein [Cellulomonas fengjieae]|uniref:RecBCD enzyme subunit RecB n=1 Tax=Cellulomonas fengjieae TaxID=2819978 RepID=A0ABS3SG36_9CELL|nr:UvrD-helicase domain-containing protein [Cellulomonas fengjieae]MBO3084715.1 UvrD-helicase domain-containing protein [Cellulomonas fengjieae]QVI66963.1 UvrD-helicase domain-containing protein [Cellulomonas fengjieae]
MTAPFDVCGPLPQGTVVLEASAGTGKTTTIASLAVRYVAEGIVRLPELMLVTFGRLATSELRERVRERFVVVERALRDPTVTSTDPVVALLAGRDRAARAQRLTVALAEFDAATITTTHGLCQQMLTSLGTLGDVEPDARLVPDIASLEAEVVDDLYLRKYASAPDPTLSVRDARAIAHEAISDAAATLEPADADSARARDSYGLATAARRELERRKRALRVLDYDDLLVLLRDALVDRQTGDAAAERVRARYRIVMVDEFQDTDPIQWDILRTAFHGHRTLVLIGDPKQAIYRFRGADVATYLRARAVASTQTLHRNWRADPAVLDGLAPILSGTALGDPRIVVHPIEPARTGRRLRGGPAVRLRQVTRAAVGAPDDATAPPVGKVRELVYADVAAQVLRTLGEEQIADGDGWRPVAPGDIAVLTRVNRDAVAVQRALTSAGVPAVISMLSSVFATPSARDWLVLLSALARPGVGGFVAAAALTPFVGWTAAELAGASDERRDELADLLRTWSRVLDDHGVASLLEATAAAGLRERLVRLPDGERRLTDVRHVGEALHAAATEDGLGAAALLEWLRARVEEAGQDYTEERSRRLETDTAAVQVITVHASKGLQFPVVLVPFLWDRFTWDVPTTIGYDRDDTRLLHVGGKGSPGYDEARAAGAAADDGEGLRLAYVALTRATSQVVLWWAPSKNSVRASLTRLLLGPRDAEGNPAELVRTTTDARTSDALRTLTVGGALELEVVTAVSPAAPWAPPTTPAAELSAARLGRRPDVAWRRTSYSALTAAAHDATVERRRVGSEPESPGIQDEPDVVPAAVDATAPAHDPSPMADLPSGTAFGTFAHRVLELVDTSAPDLAAELAARCAEAGSGVLLATDAATTADALLPSLRTPLGPLAGGLSLAEIAPRDRLAELEFELPLAGGDLGPRDARTVRDVARLLRTHLRADDPFAPYADHLDDPALAADRLRGYLTGSIDAVLRVPADVPGGHRYLVVDYKTNRLGAFDEPLSLWHYRPEATRAAMMDAHYPLQLLLYSAALHRYLRWRLPAYDPAAHLGGGLYLFLRGMAGPTTPVHDGVPFGVVSWRPPAALVVALSDLLAGS